MSHFRSLGTYALANAGIGLLGMLLTVLAGKLLGAQGFGELASCLAWQNIWAGLGFMRIDTRFATSVNGFAADRVLLAGFFAGGAVSAALALAAALLWGLHSPYWLVFVSGFALATFDALAGRHAYAGRQRQVVWARAARVLWPLLLAVLLAGASGRAREVFVWQSVGTVGLALAMWRRWLPWRRWLALCRRVVGQHRRGLVPSLALCLLNGVWLNGLTPALQAYASASVAGQFAMLQRVLGGSLGLISTATAMVFARQEHVQARLPQVRKLFLANLACSVLFCVAAAPLFLGGGAALVLGSGWTYAWDLFVAVGSFLALSYSVGAVSVLAVRLRDEWFLTIWQALALALWGLVFLCAPREQGVQLALHLGALMYVVLGLRWYFLLKKND